MSLGLSVTDKLMVNQMQIEGWHCGFCFHIRVLYIGDNNVRSTGKMRWLP